MWAWVQISDSRGYPLPRHDDQALYSMSVTDSLFESSLRSLKLLHRGKVRDIYEIDADRLLIVQTDRLSAFDVVLPTPVPGKGEVLTALSLFWFRRLAHVIPNHLLDTDPLGVVTSGERDQVAQRSMVVRRLTPLPIEAIVRGYVAGSGWREYQRTGSICGVRLAPGLREADKLPSTIFAPSTKAPAGTHDENIPFAEAERLLGPERAAQVRQYALALYSEAAEYALSRGIIVADTKFEFGTDRGGSLYLIDEALTPDSSRFWPVDQYRPGNSPPSFDKQYVRDWLESQNWDKNPPAPALPPDVRAHTAEKYREVLDRLTSS
jgi:phosphoribosylaminoimidazole-succinocarboxamide synthase